MTKLAFTGDIAFSRYFKDSCHRSDLVADEVVAFLNDSDHAVLNVEGPVMGELQASGREFLHANPAEAVDWLLKLNGTIWTLANNHMRDCGSEGIESCLSYAKENGCQTIGAGMNIEDASKPVIINQSGGIGLLSVTYDHSTYAKEGSAGCFSWADDARIEQQIKKIKQTNRWCVVVAHCGAEFSHMPLPHVRKQYKKYLDFGADAVIGHHPHVMQNYETFGDKIIFYSLGNFIFDTDYQRAQKKTEYGMLVKLKFDETKLDWDYLPIKIDRETHTIIPAEHPAIFCDINAKEYRLLWPLGAKDFHRNDRIVSEYLHPERREFNKWQWLKQEWKLLQKRDDPEEFGYEIDMRYTLLGRFLYHLGYWKQSSLKDVIEYLK